MIFLSKLKTGHKATKTTLQVSMAFAQELLMSIWYNGVSKFYQRDENLDTDKWSIVEDHWKLTMTNWEQLSKLIC